MDVEYVRRQIPSHESAISVQDAGLREVERVLGSLEAVNIRKRRRKTRLTALACGAGAHPRQSSFEGLASSL